MKFSCKGHNTKNKFVKATKLNLSKLVGRSHFNRSNGYIELLVYAFMHMLEYISHLINNLCF